MRIPALRTCLLLGAGAMATGVELPGVPLATKPVNHGAQWVGMRNDAMGGDIGRNADDHRTHAFSGGWRLTSWVLAFDASILTDRRSMRRSDELSLTLGRTFRTTLAQTELVGTLGAGTRLAGNFGGKALQNRYHAINAFPGEEDPYQSPEAAGMAYAMGEAVRRWSLPWWMSPWSCPADFAIRLHAGGSVTTTGELQAEVGGDIAWVGADGQIWTGIREHLRGGKGLTATADSTAVAERGLWWVWGTGAGAAQFWGAINIDNQAALGGFDLHFDRRLDVVREAHSRYAWLLEWAGSTYGVQLRWQRPGTWTADAPWWKRALSLYSDYRYGTVANTSERWWSSTVDYRQFAVGGDIEPLPSVDGWWLVPFVQAGAGVRREMVRRAKDNQTRPAESMSPVVVTAGGLRALVPVGRVSYGLSFAMRFWKPLREARVTNYYPDDASWANDLYLKQGHELTAGLLIVAPW